MAGEGVVGISAAAVNSTWLVSAPALDRLAALVWATHAAGTAGTTGRDAGAFPPARTPDGAAGSGGRAGSEGLPGSSAWRENPDAQRVEALVELAQRGDAEAFGQLYDMYVDTVYRYVYVRVGDQQLAEDVTSETFLRALRRLDSFSWQGRDIAAWFVTIARNLIADHRKSSRFRLEVTTDELVGLDDGRRQTPTGGTAPPAPETAAVMKARNSRLVEAIRTLKPEQQECIALRFFQEFSVAETALAMGRSQGAIKQLQLRAVRALAAVLGPEVELASD
jgi:RNA polymerase sigma-70 factor (ECF subfamily)